MRIPLLLAAAASLAAAPAPPSDSRAAFLALLDRPRVPLAPELAPLHPGSGPKEFHFRYASDAGHRVPGIMILPEAAGRRPVVIALHGTGGNKESMRPFLRPLAARGFIAVAIDARYHGENSRAGIGTADYNAAIERAWDGSGEHPFYYDTVWDVMRLIDYLDTRADVDARRIGLIGFSKGGIEAYLTAAADPRVAVAIPCIGVQSFHWALEHNAWGPRIATIQGAFDAVAREAASPEDTALVRRFYDRVTPGIYGPFDGPAMVPLIAPRPLLIINGDSDGKTPLPGLKECTDAARAAYQRLGAEDRLQVRIEEKTGHKVTPESYKLAVGWFVRWLEPRAE